MSQWKIKVIVYAIFVFLMEILSVFIGGAFHALKNITDSGMEITGDTFQSIYLSYLLSPIKLINEMVTEPNPIYLLCVIGSFVLGFFVLNTNNTKNYQVESKYAVHGSQRWATYGEIVKYKQINAFSKKEIERNLLNQIEREEENHVSSNKECRLL